MDRVDACLFCFLWNEFICGLSTVSHQTLHCAKLIFPKHIVSESFQVERTAGKEWPSSCGLASLWPTHWVTNFTNKTQFRRTSFLWTDSHMNGHDSHHCWYHRNINTWTILLEDMKALPLSMIGSVQCEVFFGSLNFSTQEPSRSLTWVLPM